MTNEPQDARSDLVERLSDVLDIVAAAEMQFAQNDAHHVYYGECHTAVREAIEALTPKPVDASVERGPYKLEGLRRREVQAIGAAISTRDWHSLEQAYNSLRDKMDANLAALSAAPVDQEVADLIHDVRRAQQAASELATENAALMERLEAVDPEVQRLRDYWRDGATIVEQCLAKAEAAKPEDAPMPLVGRDAAIWHEAQANAYRHALEMMGPSAQALAQSKQDVDHAG